VRHGEAPLLLELLTDATQDGTGNAVLIELITMPLPIFHGLWLQELSPARMPTATPHASRGIP
jgi:hypothetical protein